MKNNILPLIYALALSSSSCSAHTEAALDYKIFDDYPLKGGYFYSQTESKGASWVENMAEQLPLRCEPAFTPGASLELHYVSAPAGNWRAIIRHRPIRGQDDWDNGVFIQRKPSPFKPAEQLILRLYLGGTPNSLLPQIALLLDKEPDASRSDLSKNGKADTVFLTDKECKSQALSLENYIVKTDGEGWSKVVIPLDEFKLGPAKFAEEIKGVILEQGKSDGKEHQVFLDQIQLRPQTVPAMPGGLKPTLTTIKAFERHIDISWSPIKDERVAGILIERSTDGKVFKPIGYRPCYMSRYADFVGEFPKTFYYRIRLLGYDDSLSSYSELRSAGTHALNDDELISMVQEACARYYFDGAEENSGMTLESVPGDRHMIATGASGFGISSLVVAAQRGFIARDIVAQRMLKILNFLEHADRFHGVMAHYYDGSTGHPQLFFGPVDNGGDLVETSFLMQGLLTARQFFDANDPQEKTIREKITKLWEAVEWDWYRQTPDSHYLYWHWSPDHGWQINHRLIGWNESMITYLLAIASPKHAVPAEMFYSGFASQERLAQEYRGDGAGKMYSNGETFYGKQLKVGGFSGGPIFFTHYNFMGLNPHGLRDRYTDYFENSKAIVQINLRYCQANPQRHQGYGDEAWGLSASDGPWGYNPDEARAEGDKGKITPTGAVASMPYLPSYSLAALKNYYRNYGSFLWGEYGFRDAFSLDSNWVDDLYMGLNQAPMVVMLENYRSGTPWKLFGSNPEIIRMRRRVFLGE